MKSRLVQLLPREIRWVGRQVRPYTGFHALRGAMIVVSTLLALVDPLLMKWLIDELLGAGRPEFVAAAAGGFFLVYLLRLSINGVSSGLAYKVAQRTLLDVRLELLSHLQKLSPRYHKSHSVGSRLYRLEHDVANVQPVCGDAIGSAGLILLHGVFSVAVMAVLSWKLTLIVLPLIPAYVLLRRYFRPRLLRLGDRTEEKNDDRVSFLQDHLGALVQIQILQGEHRELRRFLRFARRALESRVRRRYLELALGLSSILLVALATSVVLGVGGFFVIGGALTVGGLVAFYTYLNRLFNQLQNSVDLYALFQRAFASVRRILTVLDHEPGIQDAPGAVALPESGAGKISIDRVSFAYERRRPVLHGVSLQVRRGESVSLVGESGSGKSTLAMLMVRLYEPQAGAIELDDLKLEEIKVRSLRRAITLVPQEPVLFDLSLRENLLHGRSSASQSEVRRAMEVAQLEEVVYRLPQGLETPLGPRGEILSVGERQRVAIARSVLQRPDFLILDEATSALDAPTEARLLSELRQAMRRRMGLIIIAHRLSSVVWADRIAVLQEGRLVEVGDHRSLYRKEGVYRELFERQLFVRPAA